MPYPNPESELNPNMIVTPILKQKQEKISSIQKSTTFPNPLSVPKLSQFSA